ncbi:MAG TPA: hypothetical protein VFC93_15890 [Chloroflexota bacterium]|nr:hypothetical protein [Chloroflexota bacterium]
MLRDVAADRLAVLLEDGRALVLGGDEFTNFSLAARRAWRTMPKRAGRPRSANPTRRPISVRLDLDVWRDLVRAAELGLIESRDRTINAWVRERLDGLLRKTAPGRRRQHVGGAD